MTHKFANRFFGNLPWPNGEIIQGQDYFCRFKDPNDEMIATETREFNQETKRNQLTQKSSKNEEQGIIVVWVDLFYGLFLSQNCPFSQRFTHDKSY